MIKGFYPSAKNPKEVKLRFDFAYERFEPSVVYKKILFFKHSLIVCEIASIKKSPLDF